MFVRETASLQETSSLHLCIFRTELVFSVASKLADILGVEILEYILSDSQNMSSLQEVHEYFRNLSADYLCVPRFYGSNSFPLK